MQITTLQGERNLARARIIFSTNTFIFPRKTLQNKINIAQARFPSTTNTNTLSLKILQGKGNVTHARLYSIAYKKIANNNIVL